MSDRAHLTQLPFILFPHLWFSDSTLSLSAWVTFLWHIKPTIVLKRRVTASGFLLILYANQAATGNASLQKERNRKEGEWLPLSLSVISQDRSFLMDFRIFVCEVIWYVSIRLWLAPHGAANRWSGCLCANITLMHPFLLLHLLLLSVTASKPLCHIFSPEIIYICLFFIV